MLGSAVLSRGHSFWQHNSAVDYDIRAVDFVMCDQFVTLPFRICQQRRIPCHMFVVTSALALFTTMTVDEDTATAKQKQFFAVKTAAPLDKSIGRQFAEINMHFMMRCNTAIQYASTIVVDTFRDLEMGALSMIAEDHRTAGAAVYAIGPLLTEDEEEGTQGTAILSRIQQAKYSNYMNSKNPT